MPPLLRLSVMPAVGLAFLLAAFFWCERELKLRLFGEPAEGRVIGMALQREGHADLLAGLDIDLVLLLANGDRITSSHADGTLVRAAYLVAPAVSSSVFDADAAPRDLDAAALDPDSPGSALSPELRRVLDEARRGDATALQWALQREGRRPDDPLRVLRIEKIETVRGWFAVPAMPEVLGLEDGRLLLNEDGSASAHAGAVRIRAVFDRSDPAAVDARKGDALLDYAYERDGQAVTPAKRNFFLQAEPYATEFRPVFAYQVAGRGVARLSHIGRQGGPTLALRLHEPCRVYFDPEKPAQAVVTALPGPVAGAPLAWFSRLCEGIFAQWGAASLIALAGLMFIGTGLLFVSLAIWPAKPRAPA
ncbi:MAG: hypothetical protein H7067_05640 [Burkholderiales bacterium]|nr:hypothetical protein [Opitutaceae bacterium]